MDIAWSYGLESGRIATKHALVHSTALLLERATLANIKARSHYTYPAQVLLAKEFQDGFDMV
jgi:hypothetical protein